MSNAAPLAIIAGTGFYSLAELDEPVDGEVMTSYGMAKLTAGEWHGQKVLFLSRHGAGHTVPPHMINYRANIEALVKLGVTDVFAINAVGGIDPHLAPGDLVLIDDFVDFTRSRVGTFFDGSTPEGVVHTDIAQAYHPELRAEVLAAAASARVPLRDGGTYACFEGPRFESAAEIRLAGLAGAHVAGMTGVPEVTLAAERGLRYACVSLVTNPCTGLGTLPITIDDVNNVLARASEKVLAVMDALVAGRAA